MITESIDVAQVVLYVFWVFFFGLIFWLRREDRREGYPLESGVTGALLAVNGALIPPPKTFILPNGAGTVQAPNLERDRREVNASGRGVLSPSGNPMLSGVGPASYAMRDDHPELMHDGSDMIVPMRIAPGIRVNAGPDPRGFKVVAGDGKVTATVTDIWVEKNDVLVRYLEVELDAAAAGAGGTRLVPISMLRIQKETKTVDVVSILSAQFGAVPQVKEPNRVTVLEEEKISAYYAGGRLYAEPKRLGPLL
jgi:photosynthetic reaction center H subunit